MVSAHCHRTTLPRPPYFTACSSVTSLDEYVLAAPTAPQLLRSFIHVFFGQRFGQKKTRACCAHLFPRPSLAQTVLLVSLQAHEESDRAKVEGSKFTAINLFQSTRGTARGTRQQRPFPIYAGVRQRCALSPHFFCSVLQRGMSVWRHNAETKICGLGPGASWLSLMNVGSANCYISNFGRGIVGCPAMS